jgi:hypothetical protein
MSFACTETAHCAVKRASVGAKLQRTGVRIFRLWVIVGNGDNIGAGEKSIVVAKPRVHAAWIRRRRETERDRRIRVALALAEKHALPGFHCIDRRAQPIEPAVTDSFDISDPAPLPSGRRWRKRWSLSAVSKRTTSNKAASFSSVWG